MWDPLAQKMDDVDMIELTNMQNRYIDVARHAKRVEIG